MLGNNLAAVHFAERNRARPKLARLFFVKQ